MTRRTDFGDVITYVSIFTIGMVVGFVVLAIQSRFGGWTGSDGHTYTITRVG